MADREVVSSASAPAAIGPYSQAILHDGLLYCSGSIALAAADGELQGDSAADQTRQCLQNLAAIASAAGTSLARALRLTIYTTRLGDFAAINEVYAEAFANDPPARVTVGVAELPKGALVEIDAIIAAP